MPNPMTEAYINNLTSLKHGDLGKIRSMQYMDNDIQGFDLFTSIWWTLREKSPRAPKREAAWLIMKLYAAYPIPHLEGTSLCARLKEIPVPNPAGKILDSLINLSLIELEKPLLSLLRLIYKNSCESLDWVKLTDDISGWDFGYIRSGWINEYNHNN